MMPDRLPDMPNPVRRLIVCADDLGLNDSINAAILDLAERGCLNASSVMSEGAIAPGVIQALQALPVELGLHLNFTQVFPGEAPGVWRGSLGQLIAASYLRRLSPAQVEHTIETQLDRFEHLFGRAPAYVDGHQHVHQFPQIRDALLRSLARRYAGQPIWLRNTRRPRRGPLPFAFKAAIIEGLGGRALVKAATQAGWPCSTGLVGVYDFRGGLDDYLALLEGWIAVAEAGHVLFCHPATEADPTDVLGAQRVTEYQALRHPRLAAALQCHGLSL